MPTWPGSLPTRPLEQGYEVTLRASQVRSPIDGLPIVQRQRSPGYAKPIMLTFELTSSQVDTFQSFYRTDLGNGAIAFDFTHPRTGASVSMRFIGGQPPKASAIGYNTYHQACQCEVMP